MSVYKSSGVDLEEAERATASLKAHLPSIGHFCGIYPKASEQNLLFSICEIPGDVIWWTRTTRDPTVLAKYITEQLFPRLGKSGLQPSFMVDYWGASKMRSQDLGLLAQALDLVGRETDCQTIGGETAEMKFIYRPEVAECLLFVVSGAKQIPWDEAREFYAATVDGVGTKTRVALRAEIVDGLGADIVNHCVNDLLAAGVQPRAFYYYLGRHSAFADKKLRVIVDSMVASCEAAKVKFHGGVVSTKDEVYEDDQIDLVGFTLGEVDKDGIIDGSTIAAGDILLALPSSGLHTNGYSLVNRLVEQHFLELNRRYAPLPTTLAENLLAPHRCYKEELEKVSGLAKGVAHITGGGIYENLGRILPKGVKAVIRATREDGRLTWPRPAIFWFIDQLLKINQDSLWTKDACGRLEAYQVFNQGVGMILVASRDNADEIKRRIECYEIGEVRRSKQKKVEVVI